MATLKLGLVDRGSKPQTVFAKEPTVTGTRLHYTLIEEKDLGLEPTIGATAVLETLRQGLEILRRHDRARFNKYVSRLG